MIMNLGRTLVGGSSHARMHAKTTVVNGLQSGSGSQPHKISIKQGYSLKTSHNRFVPDLIPLPNGQKALGRNLFVLYRTAAR